MFQYTQPATQRPLRVPRALAAFGLLALCALAAAVAGCSSPARSKVRLEAYSWWKRPSEQRAFDNVLRIYNASQSDAEAVNQVTDTNADAVRGTLTARLLAGAPPSTFQANAGADLLRWTVVDTSEPDVPSASRILDVSGIFQRNGLFDALPGPLFEALLAGPQRTPFAVPINIHRLNVIYYNTRALASFSARNSGRSFLNRDVLCPPDLEARLAKPDSKLDLKIAVGTQDPFALTLFALESVLPAIAGPQQYDDLFHGTPASDWQVPVGQALRCVQYLSRSFLDDRDKNWADALAQVQMGSADFSVMGDWANGELSAALDRGEVDARPFPGSEQTFVFTSDTFPLPRGVPYAAYSEALLDTIASGEAQLEFSREKGSFPARRDVDISTLGERAASARQAFESGEVRKVLATSGLFPPYYPDGELSAKLSLMTQPRAPAETVTGVIDFLSDMQPLLVRWQERLAEGPSDVP
jgi:glucose/mannose transport system substrate-binding protein